MGNKSNSKPKGAPGNIGKLRAPSITPAKINPSKLTPKAFSARTPAQVAAKLLLEKNDLIFLVGPAGVAKTTLAAAQAVEDLLSKRAKKIVLSRACVEAGDPVGFLPGDMMAKMKSWLQPVLDSLGLFLGAEVVEALLQQGVIELVSMTYLRGRSIPDAVIIIDEFQNASPSQGKLALTRAGENCRVIVTCDPDQIDLDNDKPSACDDLYIFENEPGIAIVDFSAEDVTRSENCRRVLRCYEKKQVDT